MVAERRLPQWLKVKMPGSENYRQIKGLLDGAQLNTVCAEAHCPNIGECWDRGTATFMILGEICTRACAYCAVDTGKPEGIDLQEPIRVAETVQRMGLKYVVITSVDRDDLPDGGAFIFAQTIRQTRKRMPNTKIEVLIPDFQGDWDALAKVMDARPETLNHNIETVRRVFSRVRPKGDYDQSLELLAKVREIVPNAVTKSGMMVGLGEAWDEILETMEDLRSVDCDLLTIGQYLRPSKKHVALAKWYTPREFDELAEIGMSMGFSNVASGPLVRSSYHADEQHASATGSAVAV
jgi:lipoic acid synthetase